MIKVYAYETFLKLHKIQISLNGAAERREVVYSFYSYIILNSFTWKNFNFKITQ